MRHRATALLLLASLAFACSDSRGSGDDARDATPDVSDTTELGTDLADGSGDLADGSGDLADGSGDTGPDVEPAFPPGLVPVDEAFAAVDPFIGSGGVGFGYAALTPAAQVPNGMVKLGPDTTNGPYHPAQSHFSGYNFDDPHIRGFSHTRFVGTGATDFCNLRMLPVTAIDERPAPSRYAIFDRDSQYAEPGYYRVRLLDPDAVVETTATQRAGFTRVTTSGAFTMLFDAAAQVEDAGIELAEVTVDPVSGRIEGSVAFSGGFAGRAGRVRLFFVGEPSRPPVAAGTWAERYSDALTASGPQAGATLTFDSGEPVTLAVAISFVDLDGARGNFTAEAAGVSFDTVRSLAADAWRSKLGRIRIGGAEPDVETRFFTAFANTYRMPTRYDDVDGRFVGVDGLPDPGLEGGYLSDLSLWDTFRTLHSWYLLVDPDLQRASLRSLIRMGDTGGFIPRWPSVRGDTGSMDGTSADFLFGESAIKGLAGVDYARAWELLMVTANPPVAGSRVLRNGIEDYLGLGYLPVDRHSESVSQTLEYAYADAALATLATALGRDADAATFAERSHNARNLFDPTTRFFQPRLADGTFAPVERRDAVYMGAGPYTEGSAWHYRFCAPHDLEALVEAFGGPAAFGEALETFFARSSLGRPAKPNLVLPDPYYWHGNEPDIHSAWLFYASDRPERAAYWIRQIQTRLYGSGPDGLPGNDDGGTLSAWYLFAAVGLFPVAGTDRYILGSPLVPLAEVPLEGGALLRIEAPGASAERYTVRGVLVNGEPWTSPTITHADLLGATLRFDLVDGS
jgi:predicted alpha-1,2-mannosidase